MANFTAIVAFFTSVYSILLLIFSPAKSPEDVALQALDSDDLVKVTESFFYWSFMPETDPKSVGFIFFTGGYVDERSYAPLMRGVAEAGYPAVAIKSIFDAAIFSPWRAFYPMLDYYDEVDAWVIGGHSLGGVTARLFTSFAVTIPFDRTEGVVLLGANGGSDLSGENVGALTIWGNLDGLVTRDEWEGDLNDLPKGTKAVEIDGGNHAQFGYYGDQDGDNDATISAEEQQQITIDEIALFMASLE